MLFKGLYSAYDHVIAQGYMASIFMIMTLFQVSSYTVPSPQDHNDMRRLIAHYNSVRVSTSNLHRVQSKRGQLKGHC